MNAVIHIEFGAEYLVTMLDHFGTDAFNVWLYKMLERLPLSWEKGCEPPACLWFAIESADFSGRHIDGLDLGLFDCEGASFQGAIAVGALFGQCRDADFRRTDLRDATFLGNISGANFTDAIIDGASFADSYYHADDPPIGLPADLLQGCCLDHDDEPPDWGKSVTGLVTYPVNITASLAESSLE
jgi:hypothetical protein